MVHDMILKVLSKKGHVWWYTPTTPATRRLGYWVWLHNTSNGEAEEGGF